MKTEVAELGLYLWIGYCGHCQSMNFQYLFKERMERLFSFKIGKFPTYY